jgi:hypothetical protein
METLSDLAAGKAGEYLVCADLILKGHTAFLSEQGLPFDVIADVSGRLLRVQVKTTRETRAVPQRKETHTPAYLYHIKRCGKGGKATYGDRDVDLFALVALDTRDIGYLPASLARQTMMFRSSAYRGQYHDEQLKVRCDTIRAMKAGGSTNAAIAREMGLDLSYVGRVLNGKSGMSDTLETYLSDMTFAKALAAL